MTDFNQEQVAMNRQNQDQPDQRQVRLRVDDREMVTRYANAFRGNALTDEVMIDFGVNSIAPGQVPPGNAAGDEVRFEVTNRTIMNYRTAKRLAMLLGNLVRQHEERFGELKLNAADRAQPPEKQNDGQ